MTDQLDLFAGPAPPDEAARKLVVESLDETLLVSAGAGSGKTTALVARVVNLVLSGIPITRIAAVTFTEKAAAELRHRLRIALAEPRPDPAACVAAMADLDKAPIGTLHAFARRLLAEFPVESALPPHFEVLDEVQSAIAFDERYTGFVEALLDDPASVRLAELCDGRGFGFDHAVRKMAEDFQANWDLVEARVVSTLPTPEDPGGEVLAQRCADLAATDVPPGDGQEDMVARFGQLGHRLAGASSLGETIAALAALAEIKVSRCGNQTNWKRHGAPAGTLDTLRVAEQALAAIAHDRLVALDEERRLTLGAVLRTFTLDAVEERRAAGQVEFHDLLVLARRLLADHPQVRAALHERYERILLDEFQDTDPIQLELAVRITAAPADQPEDWRHLRPLPGRLFMVGDAKQSIYRFRRADISQFLGATALTAPPKRRCRPTSAARPR